MQFEATTWESTRAFVDDGGGVAVHDAATVTPEADGGIELVGRSTDTAGASAAMAVEVAGYPPTRRSRRARRHRERVATGVDTGALGVVAPILDALALIGVLAGLGLWSPSGALWAGLTFALLRDTASASPHRRLNVGVLDDVGPLATRIAFSLLVLLAITRFTGEDATPVGIACLPLAVLASRFLSSAAVRTSRRALGLLEPTVVVGTGETALRLAGALEAYPEYGCQPIGFMDAADPGSLPLPFLGDPRDIGAVVDSLDVRRVIIAADDDALVDVIRDAASLSAEIYLLPRFHQLNLTASPMLTEQVRGVPLLHLPRRALRSSSWRLKRAFDAVASALALAVLSPFLLLVGAAIRLTSPGPMLFRQRRIGMEGRPFELLKFRTMRLNSDGETTWSVRYDSRVTRLGRVLRRTGIDELPQLINVLRGEMSLVGPRPERPYFVERFSADIPGYTRRLRVPPGITGWAQVHGLRGDTSVPERVQFDNHYVENWSIWRDIGIILRTVMAMKAGNG